MSVVRLQKTSIEEVRIVTERTTMYTNGSPMAQKVIQNNWHYGMIQRQQTTDLGSNKIAGIQSVHYDFKLFILSSCKAVLQCSYLKNKNDI